MEVVVTGGGTGGHIYPALEVARQIESSGHRIVYLGSNRGQESAVCRDRGIEFHGFDSAPLYSLKELRGWKSLMSLLAASGQVKTYLKAHRPAVIFSTGGYSAAPVMSAARSLKIPYVIHEANSVPGRSNRMFANAASGFTCVFEDTKKVVSKAVRTGQPVRAELRSAVGRSNHQAKDLVFCLGGSQGSVFLNQIFPEAMNLVTDPFRGLLAAGKANFETSDWSGYSSRTTVEPFLETADILEAYCRAKVVVARSGGTVAELAMFGIPSVLIPLPSSADDHQTKNAEELVRLGGAKLLRQADATSKSLANAINGWIEDEKGYQRGHAALQEWDRPDATKRIADLVVESAESKARK